METGTLGPVRPLRDSTQGIHNAIWCNTVQGDTKSEAAHPRTPPRRGWALGGLETPETAAENCDFLTFLQPSSVLLFSRNHLHGSAL